MSRTRTLMRLIKGYTDAALGGSGYSGSEAKLRSPSANGTSDNWLNEVIGAKADTEAAGAVTATDTVVAYVKQLVSAAIAAAASLVTIDGYFDVPAKDNLLNAQIAEVIGNKTDTEAAGAVTATDTIVAYIKQLVSGLIVVDGFFDVPAKDNLLNAQIAEVIGNKTDTEAAGAVTDTDTAIAYLKQLVSAAIAAAASLVTIDGYFDVPAKDNVLNAQIAEVIGNKTDTTAAGAVTDTDTAIAYLKQLVTAMIDAQSKMHTKSGFQVATKTITFTGAGPYNAFTVTGLVACYVVGYVSTPATNDAHAASVGTATSAAGLIAATAGTAMQTVGQVWVDNAPSKFETLPSTIALIGNGEDIIVTIGANLIAGVVDLYCFYYPIAPGSSLVAA